MADWHFLNYSLHKFLPIIKCPKVPDASSSTWALEPTSPSFPSLFWVVSLFSLLYPTHQALWTIPALSPHCLNHFSFSQSFFSSLPASSAFIITLNYYLLVVNFFFFWSCVVANGILVPLSGIEPRPTQEKALIPNHWTTSEFPWLLNLIEISQSSFSVTPQIVLTFLTFKNLLEILLVFVLLFSHFLSPLCIPLAYKTFL